MKAHLILDRMTEVEQDARALSRREALHQLGAFGAVLAIAAVPALSVARRVFAQGTLTQPIIDALNFALTLEYLEDDFYTTGLAASGLIPTGDRPIFTQISKHETAHVALLKTTLGANAVAKPTFDFTAGGAFADVFTNYATFQAVAQGFEDTGVRAYKGQAPLLISNKAILTTALQIHSVEARHASEIRRLRGQKGWITGNQTDVAALAAVYAGEDNHTQAGVDVGNTAAATESFDEPLDKAQVLQIAAPFVPQA